MEIDDDLEVAIGRPLNQIFIDKTLLSGNVCRNLKKTQWLWRQVLSFAKQNLRLEYLYSELYYYRQNIDTHEL